MNSSEANYYVYVRPGYIEYFEDYQIAVEFSEYYPGTTIETC